MEGWHDGLERGTLDRSELNMIAVVVLLVLVALFALFVIVQYNGLVRFRNETQNAWAQVDVVLRRRYDLIPNLVDTVEGYAAHEHETLEAVIQARSTAIDTSAVAEQAGSENILSGALKRLFALSESYPALKADNHFMVLQEEVVRAERRIAFARGAYNEAVLKFNKKVQVVPSKIIAEMFNFSVGDFCEIDDAASGPVAVQF